MHRSRDWNLRQPGSRAISTREVPSATGSTRLARRKACGGQIAHRATFSIGTVTARNRPTWRPVNPQAVAELTARMQQAWHDPEGAAFNNKPRLRGMKLVFASSTEESLSRQGGIREHRRRSDRNLVLAARKTPNHPSLRNLVVKYQTSNWRVHAEQ